MKLWTFVKTILIIRASYTIVKSIMHFCHNDGEERSKDYKNAEALLVQDMPIMCRYINMLMHAWLTLLLVVTL